MKNFKETIQQTKLSKSMLKKLYNTTNLINSRKFIWSRIILINKKKKKSRKKWWKDFKKLAGKGMRTFPNLFYFDFIKN